MAALIRPSATGQYRGTEPWVPKSGCVFEIMFRLRRRRVLRRWRQGQLTYTTACWQLQRLARL
jgi:hypothetical protein